MFVGLLPRALRTTHTHQGLRITDQSPQTFFGTNLYVFNFYTPELHIRANNNYVKEGCVLT